MHFSRGSIRLISPGSLCFQCVVPPPSAVRNLWRCCSSQMWGCEDVKFLSVASLLGYSGSHMNMLPMVKAIEEKLSLFVRCGLNMPPVMQAACHKWCTSRSSLDLAGEGQISPMLLRPILQILLVRVSSLSSAFKICFLYQNSSQK